MGLAEAINKLKDISKKLRDPNVAEREIVFLNIKLHETIDLMEIPEMINVKDLIGENNEYIS